MFRLVAFIREHDSDILPFFLDHYRTLGVGAFHVFLHGDWSETGLSPLSASDVAVAGIVQTPYSDDLSCATIDDYARKFPGEWLLIANCDEFLELPQVSLRRTVAALRCLGLEELAATVLQRTGADGHMPSLSSLPPQAAYPFFDDQLAERMGEPTRISRIKYPLVRVGPKFSFARGDQLPHSGRPTLHIPLRGVLHHVRWRDRLRSQTAGLSHGEEQDHGVERVAANGFQLAEGGLRRCSRAELFSRGHLLRPNRAELRRVAALRKCRDAQNGTAGEKRIAERRAADIPNALPQHSKEPTALLDRRSLTTAPGRIALVTTELAGFYRAGGIGTAMAALAERLSWAGHDVHVLFCPYVGDAERDLSGVDYWESRGVALHYFPRRRTAMGYVANDAFSIDVCDQLRLVDWDVIHFHDNGGIAAAALLLRAAGLAFWDSRIVVTAHGPTTWHRTGNLVAWDANEAIQSHLEAVSMKLADVVVGPSRYILDWCRDRFASGAPHLPVPNSLTGESRRFRQPPRAPGPVSRIVFFGRMEMRKGIDVFIDAIDGVLATGLRDFEVIFLGRLASTMHAEISRRIARWPCQTRVITDLANHEAIEFLRNTNCIAVLPSRADSAPYTVYECLENGIPFLAAAVGGIPELISEADHPRVLVSGGPEEYAEKLMEALTTCPAPASPSFNADLPDIDHLALHARLVGEARALRGRTPSPDATRIAVIGYARLEAEAAAGARVSSRNDLDAASPDTWMPADPSNAVLAGAVAQVSVQEEDGRLARTLNALARSAHADLLLFCGASVMIGPQTLPAMRSALEASGADAVVCGYWTADESGAFKQVAVFAGPSEISPLLNIYGEELLLVRKECFLEAGGFAEDRALSPILHWEFLNRIKAGGRNVSSVPHPLHVVPRGSAAAPLPEYRLASLAAPWTAAAPPTLQGFLRMAVAAAAKERIGSPSGKAGAGLRLGRSQPAEADMQQMRNRAAPARRWEPHSPLAAIAEATDDTRWPARPHVAPSLPKILPASTYVIDDAADAAGCDFLVLDDFLAREQCRLLAFAFDERTRTLLQSERRPAGRELSFLHCAELSGETPAEAEAILNEVLHRAIQLTEQFYALTAGLHVAEAKLSRVRADGSAAIPSFGRAPMTRHHDFAGVLCLEAPGSGGEILFPEIEIAVKPVVGRFIAATGGRYHEFTALGISSGAQLLLSFALNFKPDFMSER